VPPSKHAPGLPAALDEVTLRGLRVDPTERFPTARDMARALEEAIPLATALRIGDWVETAAKQTLDARSARIASIESDSSLQAPQGMPSAVDRTEDVVVTDGTQLSSASASGAGAALPSRPRRLTAWLASAGGAAVLLVAAFWASSSRRTPPGSAHTPASLPVAASPGAPAPSASAPEPEGVPPVARSPSPSPALDAASSAIEPRTAPGHAASPPRPTVRAPGQLPPPNAAPAPSPAKPAYDPMEHL
jgi:serine/threonine-protein kinase